MKSLRYIWPGASIWAIIFIVISALIGFGANVQNATTDLISVVVIGLLVLLLTRQLEISSKKQALQYAFGWVVTMVLLDMIITVRFTGWEIFSQWTVIVGYLLVLILPVLVTKNSK